MKVTTVRLDEKLYERLRDMAETNQRSVNKQMIIYIIQGLADDEEYYRTVEEEL